MPNNNNDQGAPFWLAKMGIYPEPTWCTHGYSAILPAPNLIKPLNNRRPNNSSANNKKKGSRKNNLKKGGDPHAYPYNVTTEFVLNRIMFHLNKSGVAGGGIRSGTGACAGIDALADLLDDEGHVQNCDDRFVESCVLLGTDLLRHSNNGRNTMNVYVSACLAKVILVVEENLDYSYMYAPTAAAAAAAAAARQSKPRKSLAEHFDTLQGIYMDMQCIRDIILFYDERTMCSCLDLLKEKHPHRMGVCGHAACATWCLDHKLLICSDCHLIKYCSRTCQVADWPLHKKFCKEVQEKQPPSLTHDDDAANSIADAADAAANNSNNGKSQAAAASG